MWRLVLVLGAAVIGYGCNRRNEDSGRPATPSIPQPVTPPPRTTPLIPPEFTGTGRFNPNPPVAPPVMTPRGLDCSRFSNPIVGSNINNAKLELERLQLVMPYLNRHIDEMRRGDFRSAREDQELSLALSRLQGIGIYLFDGITNIIDTENDWANLNSALAYLNVFSTVRSDGNPNSEESQAARAWERGSFIVQFRGFMFRTDELPQGLGGQRSDGMHFRIITPTRYGNNAQFRVLQTCNIDPNSRDHYTTVSF